MAIPMTGRNLALCTNCQDCVTGGKCRLFRGQKIISFRLAKAEHNSPEYWRGYYDANRDILLGKRRKWSKDNRCKGWASERFHALTHEETPDKCSRCGKGGRIIAHHPDYTDPLTVEWLCNGCHLKEHRQTA